MRLDIELEKSLKFSQLYYLMHDHYLCIILHIAYARFHSHWLSMYIGPKICCWQEIFLFMFNVDMSYLMIMIYTLYSCQVVFLIFVKIKNNNNYYLKKLYFFLSTKKIVLIFKYLKDWLVYHFVIQLCILIS